MTKRCSSVEKTSFQRKIESWIVFCSIETTATFDQNGFELAAWPSSSILSHIKLKLVAASSIFVNCDSATESGAVCVRASQMISIVFLATLADHTAPRNSADRAVSVVLLLSNVSLVNLGFLGVFWYRFDLGLALPPASQQQCTECAIHLWRACMHHHDYELCDDWLPVWHCDAQSRQRGSGPPCLGLSMDIRVACTGSGGQVPESQVSVHR